MLTHEFAFGFIRSVLGLVKVVKETHLLSRSHDPDETVLSSQRSPLIIQTEQQTQMCHHSKVYFTQFLLLDSTFTKLEGTWKVRI